MREVVTAREDKAVRELMESISAEDEAIQVRMWNLVKEFGLIDARRTMSLVEARLRTIENLQVAVRSGATEVPEIHNIVKADSWLLDPRWHLLDDEIDLASLDIDYKPESDAASGRFLDFLFVLQPRPPAHIDEVVVVEIKRGTYPDGRVRTVNDSEIEKFATYVSAVKEHYSRNTHPPSIKGLMVAQNYSARAEAKRRMYEQVTDPTMGFKTWDSVIEETRRMHVGWLELSRRRAGGY